MATWKFQRSGFDSQESYKTDKGDTGNTLQVDKTVFQMHKSNKLDLSTFKKDSIGNISHKILSVRRKAAIHNFKTERLQSKERVFMIKKHSGNSHRLLTRASENATQFSFTTG